MRESLSHILVHYYPLACRLNWIQGDRLKLDCNAKGAMLLEAQSNKSMAEYGDFSPNQPIKELIPTVDYSRPIEELPLLLAQITRFKELQEGIAIGIALSHPLCDGLAGIHFINSWAKKDANNDNNDFQSREPYSRFEAIGAHLWRSACKARELSKHQPTVFQTVVDIRKKLNPPLPQNYFGNALAFTSRRDRVKAAELCCKEHKGSSGKN
ncbi:hypothetical protein HN873_066116 [Arachis hypogaea]